MVAIGALIPAGFLAGLLLLGACFGETDGTGGPSPRQDVCYAWDGGLPPALAGTAAALALVCLVVSLRRGSRGAGTWVLAALPALALVLVPLVIGLLPLR